MTWMYRATTPTHTFEIDIDPSTLKTMLLTYKQGNGIVLEKEKSDLTITSETVQQKTVYLCSFKLTQEEANLFVEGTPVQIQMRALTFDGNAYASNKVTLDVDDVLNDEVLS